MKREENFTTNHTVHATVAVTEFL